MAIFSLNYLHYLFFQRILTQKVHYGNRSLHVKKAWLFLNIHWVRYNSSERGRKCAWDQRSLLLQTLNSAVHAKFELSVLPYLHGNIHYSVNNFLSTPCPNEPRHPNRIIIHVNWVAVSQLVILRTRNLLPTTWLMMSWVFFSDRCPIVSPGRPLDLVAYLSLWTDDCSRCDTRSGNELSESFISTTHKIIWFPSEAPWQGSAQSSLGIWLCIFRSSGSDVVWKNYGPCESDVTWPPALALCWRCHFCIWTDIFNTLTLSSPLKCSSDNNDPFFRIHKETKKHCS